MKIAETQTNDDFPDGAIKLWGGESGTELLKVTDKTGTAVLWERNGTEEQPAAEPPPAVSGKPAVKAPCDLCPTICGNAGALALHKKAKHPPVAAVVEESYASSDHGRALPQPAIQALENLLSNAMFQSVRKIGDKPMEDFFYGFASGMQAALAIVCGSLGYNTDFLNEENSDLVP